MNDDFYEEEKVYVVRAWVLQAIFDYFVMMAPREDIEEIDIIAKIEEE